MAFNLADPLTGFGTGQSHFQPTSNIQQSQMQIQQQSYAQQEAERQRQFQQSQTQAGYGFQGQQAGLQRTFQGQQSEAQRQLELQQSQIGAAASEFPYQLKQQRFDQLFPMFQSSFGALQRGLGGAGGPFTPGGASGASPEISVGGVYSPQQTQQQVNAQRASNDQNTEARTRQMASQSAGRGYGANSPLLQALQQGAWNQNQATNTANERETRLGAAQQNAQQTLSSQQAREAQFASRQQEDIARRQPYFAQSNALLAALSGMV